jgi:A/G-specific adenine glycosylase
MKPTTLQNIQHPLMRWYHANARQLPWRQSRDPYAIWVSEIMLQQTQVIKVKSYYQRFLERFPDIYTLAKARRDTVLKFWEGMGYYARARNLHESARLIVSEHGGQLPQTVEALAQLPGIGRYTAGAVASIAFGHDEPVLDGNVIRVLCRLFRIRTDPSDGAVQRKLWSYARQLIPSGQAGNFNQAMMELGATVCRPRSPDCGRCPVESQCQAKKHNEQDILPLRPAAKALPHHVIAAGVVWKDGRVLIGRRKPTGLLGGLWEFPGGKHRRSESLDDTVKREVLEETGVQVEVVRPLLTVEHAYTHFRITLHAYECRYLSGDATPIGCDACKWVTPRQLKNYAFPKANHKIIAALTDRAGMVDKGE